MQNTEIGNETCWYCAGKAESSSWALISLRGKLGEQGNYTNSENIEDYPEKTLIRITTDREPTLDMDKIGEFELFRNWEFKIPRCEKCARAHKSFATNSFLLSLLFTSIIAFGIAWVCYDNGYLVTGLILMPIIYFFCLNAGLFDYFSDLFLSLAGGNNIQRAKKHPEIAKYLKKGSWINFDISN